MELVVIQIMLGLAAMFALSWVFYFVLFLLRDLFRSK